MGRVHLRQTERANIDEDAISSAVNEVNNGNLSIRKAADKYNIKPATLQHRLEKLKRAQQNSSPCEIYQTQDTLSQENPTTTGGTNIHLENADEQDKPSTSNQIPDSISPVCVSNIISPECVRPYPRTIRKVSKKRKINRKIQNIYGYAGKESFIRIRKK
ncbi:hypothetical protein JTB14_000288 [Gonioctena quinquepunctata]|nr:hypothetical protein JTB14_000288 [Gonioctena quinquepunctata]